MPKDYDIRLRGHHLRVLYYFSRNRKIELYMKWLRWNWNRHYHDRKHTENAIKVLEKICTGNIRIKLTDRLDDICRACPRRRKKSCRKFVPYGVKKTAAIYDHAASHNLGFKIGRVYRSRYILRKLKRNWFDC